jgi:hypothetical protein
MIFTVSARRKPENTSILNFLKTDYGSIKLNQIDSVFGFLERSTLYGGRYFSKPELDDDDVAALYSVKIGVRIPLTNIYVEREEYLESRPLLEKYHKKNNSVIITNDNLAKWIKQDFPRYKVEASVIKNIKTHRKIQDYMELYDTIVLPMEINQDHNFLREVKNKKRVTLFANAGCALTCPSKICYPAVSVANKGKGGDFKCSQTLKYRQTQGMIDFDLNKLANLGFSRFKVLRARQGNLTGY